MSSSPFQAPTLEHLAELLPAYEFRDFIAQGGMGAVYQARQRSLDRAVAVKVLPRELGEDPEFRQSFETEARAMARLNHPNLIGVFDYGDVEGMPYIVMEYVPGQSLHHSAYGQAIDPEQAVAIVKGICEGLGHAHEHGIVHRDIKPANILLTPRAEPKIGDFGLAHPTDSDGPGLVMGTPGYTAPEVFIDPNFAGPIADLYSVGVILHQLLTGIDPAGAQEPPTQSSGNLRLDPIWRKATQPDPARRYSGTAEMAADLGAWLDAKRRGGLVSPATGVPASPSPQKPLKSAQSGGGGVTALLIVALVALVGFFGFKHLSKAGPAPDGPAPESQAEFGPNARKAPDPQLHHQTSEQVRQVLDDSDRKIRENTEDFSRQLATLETTAPNDQLDLVARIQRATTGRTLPAAVEIGAIDDFPELAKRYRDASQRQQELENSRDQELSRLRESYLAALDQLAARADPAQATALRARAADANDLQAWAEAMRVP